VAGVTPDVQRGERTEGVGEVVGRGQQAGRARRVGGGKEMVQADIKKSRRGNKKAETVEIVGVANGRSHYGRKEALWVKERLWGLFRRRRALW
jgi:hypothetical protein